jgi:hypothetical protein
MDFRPDNEVEFMVTIRKRPDRKRSLWFLPLVMLGLGAVSLRGAGPEPAGWYSGDMHVHANCGIGNPTNSATVLYNTMVSQDFNVLSLLADMGNGEVQTATIDLPKVNGQNASISTSNRIVHWDAEWHWDATYTQYPHQALGGHIVALGLTNAAQVWDESTYTILNWARQRGGLAGFAHFQFLDDNFPTTLSCCTPIEYPVEVALGACDFISEDIGGSDSFIHAYYRLLNCGFRPGFAAGSDYPCGSAIGQVLTYSQVAGGQLTYSNWLQGIKNGRTVVSRNGRKEFVDLKVNGTSGPGDEIRLTGGGTVPVSIQWTATQTLTGTLELVRNGVVVASQAATAASGAPVTLSTSVNFTNSGWLCARRMDSSGHQVHTAAVFVTVDQKPVRASASDAQFYVQWMNNLLQNTSAGGVWASFYPTGRVAEQARYSAARSIFQQIAVDAGAQAPPAVSIGNGNEGGSLDNIWYNGAWINAGRFQAASNITVTAMEAKVAAITGHYKCAIYADSGGQPSGLLGSTIEVSGAGAGWQAFPLTSSVALTNGSYYWLAIWSDDANAEIYYSDSGGTLRAGPYNYGAWPNPITASYSATLNYCIYATGAGAPLTNITVTPTNSTILSGSTQQFIATGAYADGSTQNVTSQATWVSSNTAVATVGASGLASGISAGTTTISATLAGKSRSSLLTVQAGALSITTPSLPNGVLNTSYSAALAASGGTAPYSWSIASGALPQGLTLNATNGTVSGKPTAAGVSSFTAQVRDVSSSVQTATKLFTVTITTVPAVVTLWSNTAVPVLADSGADSPVELGVKFRSDVAGSITGIRFYKSSANTGAHVGNLWTNTGALLATATFAGETASGWQQVNFATPVAIATGAVYVASYHVNTGHYSEDDNYFSAAGVDNPPLHALANGVSGGNGVYAYSASSVYPNQTWSAANYWVDVVFQPAAAPTLASLVVTPANVTNLVGATQQFTVTGTYSDSSTQNITSQVTWKSSNTGVAAVTAGGLATAISAGTTTISAALAGVTNSTVLTVKAPPALASIAVTPVNPSILIGGSQPFTATGTYSDSSTQNITSQVTWTSSSTGVAAVTAGGLATAISAGTTTISVALAGVTNSTVLTVKAPATLTSIAVTPANPTLLIGGSQAFTATGTYSDSSTQNITSQVTWTSSSTGVATINAGGLAAAVAAGMTTISAGLSGVNGSATLTVQVVPLAISTVSLSNGVVNVGYAATLAASGGTLPYTWSIASGSLPTGLTLNGATGAIIGIPSAAGAFNFTVRVSDVSSPVQNATKALSLSVASLPPVVTIWPSTAVPGLLDAGADSAVELGVKFRSDVAGTITGIRFYKATANTGTHVGNLWSSTGTLLGSITFSNETASGWQQMVLATPVAITSNTVYVASYHSTIGHYSFDLNYFTSKGADNPPLHALTNGVSGGNGVYAYGAGSAFPALTYSAANYWVDVVFQAAIAPTLTSIVVTPVNATNLVGATQQFTATGSYSDGSTQNLTSQAVWASSKVAVASINASGLATAVSAGSTTISAALAGVTNGTTLTVQAPPTLAAIKVTPANPTILVGASQPFTATGTYSDSSTQNITSQVTWRSSSAGVASVSAGGVATAGSAGTTSISAALAGVTNSTLLTVAATPLAIATTSLPSGVINGAYSGTLGAVGGTTPYTWSIASGSLPAGLGLNASSGAITGVPTAAGTFSFTARVSDAGSPVQTATGALGITIATATSTPILLLTNAANPFSQYFSEILLAEGLNEFTTKDISSISSATLSAYDVVLLGQAVLTAAQVTTLSNWVYNGGNLIAMRPDKQLAGLLGLADAGTTLSEGYLLVNTASGPGAGIVGQPIQFHGTADGYSLRSASSLATLYANAQTGTLNPAVTLCSVGPNGGEAAAFAFDLARSVVYTRQGNPAWANQNRDAAVEGLNPAIRSDDLFYGATTNALYGAPTNDWVNLDNVAIPQADEQQRLLANLMIYMEANRKLLPRFWYFPHGYKAVVVMTGDDHAGFFGGSYAASRFDAYLAASPQGGSVADWTAPRCTAYIYLAPSPSLTSDAQAAAYDAAGFEIGIHLNTGCSNYTGSALDALFTTQMGQFIAKYPSLPAQTTHRVHCIAWSDYSAPASVSRAHGIRLETSYYYWPPAWVADRPGLFTGSGMPMRFASTNGVVIDIYQATTQMTDESGQSYPYTVDTLLDRALGSEGYYGAFVANMHTDALAEPGADAILSSATSRGVPVISSRQLLTWLDARNGSSISSINWNGSSESFSVQAIASARGLQVMIPVPGGYQASAVACNGSPVAYSVMWIKGIEYAQFPATTGVYQVSYVRDATAPGITAVSPMSGASGVSPASSIAATFNEVMAPSSISPGTVSLSDARGNVVPGTVSYDPTALTAFLTPATPLALATTYTATVKGGVGGVTDLAGNALPSNFLWSFATFNQYATNIWPSIALPGVADSGPDSAVELGVQFRSAVAGSITGIRFYKAAANTGTHVGNLWTTNGTLLATATFSGETASGWQQVLFSKPVAIASNTVYVASYHANNGHYSDDDNYFANQGVDNYPLHALSAREAGGNGVYSYGTKSTFPNQSFQAGNYWVDVIFK